MNLHDHYRNLYLQSLPLISSGQYEKDLLIDSKLDRRFGLSLIVRPSRTVVQKIQSLISDLKKIEPHQYYYPNSDIHITVMSIISCYPGFDLNNITITDYVDLISNCLPKNQKMSIRCKGLTASPSCIMVQGFNDDKGLNNFRDKLRREFKNSSLQQTLDIRYAIQTAHSTIVRFRSDFNDIYSFIQLIETNLDINFGEFTVEEVELVYNDWYQREKLVKKIHLFNI
ncbi:2'-5' RNA ligase family protein [Membranihabitans marinus]|uniref:2'-5' RNA ligase family protein n=1 Tax=Membranihabitans marinus TaxID=1227546 RepID=UPI001F422E74|nr:hypothetical protein [Membranihabitans marinus]